MKKLNEKQIAFSEEYVRNGFKGSKAYQTAYDVKADVAKVNAHRLLSNTLVQDYISSLEGSYKILGNGMGMDKKFVLKRLKELMYAKKKIYFKGDEIGEMEDTAAANTAINTFLKTTGDIAPEKLEVTTFEEEKTVNPANLSKKDQAALKTKILEEL